MDATHLLIANNKIKSEKKCRLCGEVKPAGDFFSYKYITVQGKLSVRLDSDCKPCVKSQRQNNRDAENLRQRKRRAANPLQQIAYREKYAAREKLSIDRKACSGCKEEKPVSAFYVRRTNIDNYSQKCRACTWRVSHDRIRNLDPERVARLGLKVKLRTLYGITVEFYEKMAAQQNGRCPVCGTGDILLHVDHDHKTGKVRGLLCPQCNIALGLLKEDPIRIRALANYLGDYPTKSWQEL